MQVSAREISIPSANMHWSQLEATLIEQSAAVVTIVSTQGSTPREIGATMIITADGSFRGSIGGGSLEWQALGRAQALLKQQKPTAQIIDFQLGASLGQCCGGRVGVLFETFDQERLDEVIEFARLEKESALIVESIIDDKMVKRRIIDANVYSFVSKRGLQKDQKLIEIFNFPKQRLDLFGAGHVGKALIIALAQLDFSICWIDQREDAFPQHVPANVTIKVASDPCSLMVNMSQNNDITKDSSMMMGNAMAVVMTHLHALDYDLVSSALQQPDYAWVGLIGSKTKQKRFEHKLNQHGIEQVMLEKFCCPIGFCALKGRQPAVIAANIATQLLLQREHILTRLCQC